MLMRGHFKVNLFVVPAMPSPCFLRRGRRENKNSGNKKEGIL